MEGGRKIQALLGVATVILLTLSYSVGYYVGKEAGVQQERKKCEAEKKQLIKTLAQINPVSRPQTPIESKVVEGIVGMNSTSQTGSQVKPEKPKKPEKPSAVAENTTKKASEKTASGVPASGANGKEGAEKRAEKVASAEPKARHSVKAASEAPQVHRPSGKAGAEAKKPQKVYYLQVGVFRNEKNAEKLVKELQTKGFSARLERAGRVYKVVVGEFSSWHRAVAVQKELKREGYTSILRWRKQ
ncbi:SPOR domain-containing protein [Thermovibrio ammonificans]|uniref:Sporulation domain-containing protein n=1 Tax=Thermovibrio ammonificans (strain DSM 15698 / JCM 12110 / HB-1) TaxID=648996 RepID=E8T2I5_THEA1|nr:SPOR domain-containing protein [Thermovibrio ammonificans]ADU97080.1 Sporulation domain-containing protein [Thermovibrio ammonificans HB-1]